ncbi:MAG: hypothetical protein OSJ58_08900 [Dysosmobacter sp.]|uniref:hypothetical protein n=1 Tax=uncultured Oscillibacter sp. TaxID=876091 RepID=UPI00262E279F|nr:hypothetical protein [uncultured Oscillibacter sp.]MCX4371936.1 hypothetical protein [Dysosmobacter sp.]
MANSTVDGSVVIDVNMDVSQAEKELSRLKTKIIRLEDDLGEKAFKRSSLSSELVQARKELERLQVEKPTVLIGDTFADNTEYYEKLAAAKKTVSDLSEQIKKIDEEIDAGNLTLEYTKMRYGEILPIAENLRKEEEARAAAEKQAKEEARQAREAAKQAERQAREEEKRQEQAFKEAQAAIEAQIAQQRLLDIKESAAVADQRLVDLQEELLTLTQRRKELESAGVGLGYQEYDDIAKRTSEINAELREYQDNLIGIKAGTENLGHSTDAAGNAIISFRKRIVELVKSAFIFNVISAGLRSIQQITMKYIKTNDEARQAIAQMEGALLTLAQPLIEVLIPAFTALLNVLSRIVVALASLVSTLFGKTLKNSSAGAKALNDEAKALSGVGAAADEAAGSLAGFDEINTIQTENAGGGGGGGGASAEIAPDFSWMGDMRDLADRLKEIADLVGLIAAGLALWKIGTMLPGVLGQIATKLGGILLIIGGLLLFWHGLTDAWENGVDWLNLIEMIGGLAAAAAGLYITLGPVAAGIALVVGGIAMLITAFRDAMKNGWNLQNTLLAIAGILGTGLGISLLVGSFVPLLIAAIAAVLLALTIATGHGEELLDGIQTVMEGFVDFFTGIFTGDIEKAIGGVSKIFDGLKTAVFAVIDGIKDTLLSFLTWLDEKTGGRFHGIIETAKGFVTGFFNSTKETLGNVLDSFKQIFTGITQFLTGVFTNDWDLAWEGIKNIFKGVWNANIALLEGAINLIIKGLNWLISQMNKIKFDIPNWVPAIGGKSLAINIPTISEAKIPRLAQGAVIPPNREFMAVLGDQRHGTNLEAPEDLIRKIVREESGGGNAELVQLLQSILSAVKEGHIIMVDGSVFGRTAIKTINSVNTSAGKQLLLI